MFACTRAILVLVTLLAAVCTVPSRGEEKVAKDRKHRIELRPAWDKAPEADLDVYIDSLGQFADVRGTVFGAKGVKNLTNNHRESERLVVRVQFSQEEKTDIVVMGKAIRELDDSLKRFKDVVINVHLFSLNTPSVEKAKKK